MPLDRGTTGRDAAAEPRRRRKQPSTVAALRRQEQREARELVIQRQARAAAPPRPVRGEDPASKARAPRSRRVRFEQQRAAEIERQYGTGRAGGNRQAPGLIAGTLGPLAEASAWSFTHPRERLTGRIPERFMPRDPATGLQLSTGEFPWGPTGRFFRARRAKPEAPAPEPPIPGAEQIVSPLGEAKRVSPEGGTVVTRELPSAALERLVAREYVDPKRAASIAESIRKHGYETDDPIDLYIGRNGKAVIEGNHRPLAAIEAGVERVPVNIHHLDSDVVERTATQLTPEEIRLFGGEASLAEERIGGSLEEARRLREEQEGLYSAERSKRIGAAGEAFEEAGGGLAGHIAAKQRLAGELPKLRFDAIAKGGLAPEERDRIFNYIEEFYGPRNYKAIRARDAVQKVTDGDVPTRSEIKLLDELFGPEKTAEIAKDIELWMRGRGLIGDVVSLPRAFKSSTDVSAGLRQGGLVLASHPRIWKQAWGPSMRSMKYLTPAQRDAQVVRAAEDIMRRENFGRMQTGSVVFSGIRGGAREEAFMSSMADHIPVIGHSAQAYTVFLNRLRADFFDHLIKQGRKGGYDIDNPEFLRNTGKIVNTMTGRGSLEEYEGAVKTLAALFFSPRLMASRVKMFGRAAHPYTWTGGRGPKANPNKRIARREARRAMSSFIAGGMGILLLADQMPGVEVGVDPRSADFGKIRVGDTRIDIWGGFQQYIVLMGRVATGEKVMSDTGEVRKLEQYGTGRVFGSATDFFENKYSPNLAYLWRWDEAGEATGREFDPVKEAGLLFAPIGVQGAAETIREYGPGRAAAEFGASFVGLGAQSYGASAPKGPKTPAQKLAASVQAEEKVARKLGVQMPPAVRDALRLRSRLAAAVDRLEAEQRKRGDVVTPEGKRFKLTARQKAAAEFTVIRQVVPEHAGRLKQILDGLDTDKQIESFRRQLKDELGLGVLEQWHEETAEALEERAVAAAS